MNDVANTVEYIIKERPNPLLSTSNGHIVMRQSYAFINAEGKENPSGNSYANHYEAKLSVKIVNYFYRHKKIAPENIGVISFYSGQVKLIKKLLSQKKLFDIAVHTVDGFQGDEKDLIIKEEASKIWES